MTESWFHHPKDAEPFKLTKLVKASKNGTPWPFHCIGSFPWNLHAMETLWDGQVTEETILSGWKETAEEWMGTVAVGSTRALLIFPKLATTNPVVIEVPDQDPPVQVSNEIHCVAWALNPDFPLDPLIIFAVHSLVYIVDVKSRKTVGKLRGHGGPITSIAVHPLHPYLFCTTSRDFTSRIYDLTLPATQQPNNPPWPPGTHPNLGGPAHGLQMSEPEGDGLGQCVVVLVGNRAGGHRGAVLHAAFHPSMPLIATGGMDRAVKIWRIPPMRRGLLAREDKPLFSSDYLHRARVLSVNWLSTDILVTHSAPALLQRDSDDRDAYYENGTGNVLCCKVIVCFMFSLVTVWRWLGFDRFFPVGKPIQKIIRGCISDWRNSESFRILSSYFLPLTTLNLHIYTGSTSDPLLSIPLGKAIRVYNITQFAPRPSPSLPTLMNVTELTKQLRISHDDGGSGEDARWEGGEGKDGEGEDSDSVPSTGEEEDETDGHAVSVVSGIANLFETDGWDIRLPPSRSRAELPDIDFCEMACGGLVVIGASKTGVLSVWQLKSP
ncbi:hypothetical protein CERSUDRAFT_110665 [Gelatoporia subvermispora B]|uniref:Uncharacterized protein n=1 Tax=Ceriporiopsis subvermispora (strain B) TaxID=914234 RepID=M2RUI7_CERS8|nr:hypothetical protein CERSUDRAFT_110665 [Gelatoporia subvermispora B]